MCHQIIAFTINVFLVYSSPSYNSSFLNLSSATMNWVSKLTVFREFAILTHVHGS